MGDNGKVEIKDDETPTEVLADAIVRMSAAMDRLLKSGLTVHTIALLVKDATSVPLYQIKQVVTVLPELAKRYTIAKPKKTKR